MADAGRPGRPNQKRRTRKDLLQAAARLMQEGRSPSLEEIAEAALVSRATAYRYFPNVEALLLEAALDLAVPDTKAIFRDVPDDPVARLDRVDGALHDMSLANEAALRMMLAQSLQRGLKDADDGVPKRQNRRSPLIEMALEPSREEFSPVSLDLLTKAVAFLVGTEAMVVFRDVLQLDPEEARTVKRWAIGALVAAARNTDGG
jgi:AcrR family transcriptional regulator